MPQNSPQLDDYQWLVSDEARGWIEAAKHDQRDLVARVNHLRTHLSAHRAHLVLELIETRRRAQDKFRSAEDLYFTRRSLQQATDEVLAEYKADRFDGAAHVVDLCCGIGGDLLSLARRAECAAIESDPAVACFAQANCRQRNLASAQVAVGDAAQFRPTLGELVHIDPDRRPGGKRTIQLQSCQPGVAYLQLLSDACSGLAIKLAPATLVPPEWASVAEIEYLGSRGECRQQMLWLGNLARRAGRRVATVVDAVGQPRAIEQDDQTVTVAPQLDAFVFEPHPCVIAARLVDSLAAQAGLQRVAPRSVYLTGPSLVNDGALAAFEVEQVMALDIKRLRAYLRSIGAGILEIKCRAVDIDPAELRRRLRGDGPHQRTILLFPSAQKKVQAVIARRHPADPAGG